MNAITVIKEILEVSSRLPKSWLTRDLIKENNWTNDPKKSLHRNFIQSFFFFGKEAMPKMLFSFIEKSPAVIDDLWVLFVYFILASPWDGLEYSVSNSMLSYLFVLESKNDPSHEACACILQNLELEFY